MPCTLSKLPTGLFLYPCLPACPQLEDFTSLRTVVRRKGHKKRPLGTYNWHIGEGVVIGVRLFALVQQAKRPVVRCVPKQLLPPQGGIVDAASQGLVLLPGLLLWARRGRSMA